MHFLLFNSIHVRTVPIPQNSTKRRWNAPQPRLSTASSTDKSCFSTIVTEVLPELESTRGSSSRADISAVAMFVAYGWRSGTSKWRLIPSASVYVAGSGIWAVPDPWGYARLAQRWEEVRGKCEWSGCVDSAIDPIGPGGMSMVSHRYSPPGSPSVCS